MDFFDDSSASPAPAGDFASAPLEDFGDFGGAASPAPEAAAGGDFFGSPAGSFEAAPATGSFEAAAAPAAGSFDGSFDGGSFEAAPASPTAGGDSFGGSFDAAPAQGSFDGGSFDAAPAAAPAAGSFDGSLDAAAPAAAASDAFGGSFEGSSFDAAPAADVSPFDAPSDAPAEAAPISDAFADAAPAATPSAAEPASPASPMASFGAVQVTSDLMRQYEIEHNKFLEEKIAEEKTKHAEVVAQAKKDLDNFYAERKQRSAKARAENMAATDAATEEAPANDKDAWKNLAGLVDLNDGSKDQAITERMRSVILDMKHAA